MIAGWNKVELTDFVMLQSFISVVCCIPVVKAFDERLL